MSRKSFKYRIYLSNGQRRILEQQLEESRWVYNETLAERKRAYEERGESLRLYNTQAMLPIWKLTRPALKLVHSQVLQNISVRVDLAFQAFFRRVKAGANEVGFPRFKGFGRYDSLTYPQYGNGVRLEGAQLILSKVGAVHVVLHRPVEGTPKTVTLTRSRTGKKSVGEEQQPTTRRGVASLRDQGSDQEGARRRTMTLSEIITKIPELTARERLVLLEALSRALQADLDPRGTRSSAERLFGRIKTERELTNEEIDRIRFEAILEKRS